MCVNLNRKTDLQNYTIPFNNTNLNKYKIAFLKIFSKAISVEQY